MLSTFSLGGPAYAAFPVGIYLVVDPGSGSDFGALQTSSVIAPLFGPQVCTGSPAVCTGGVNGVFIDPAWNNFQTIVQTGTEYIVSLDPGGQLADVMANISSLETAIGGSFKFQLSIGLKAGDNAAYNVLDMYTAAGGSPSGTQPGVYTTNVPEMNNEENGGCAFPYSGTGTNAVPSGNGGVLDAAHGFPEQCALRADSNNVLYCLQQPRIWGNDASSIAANPIYIKAFVQAMQDLASSVNGVAGYGSATYAHPFQLLKIAGIANHDAEIAIPGSAGLQMPTTGGSLDYCGNLTATNAEKVWTNQASGLPLTDAYEAGILESTWLSLVTGLVGVTASPSIQLAYAIDVVGDTNFPPVHPAHCSSASGTVCSYTASTSSSISSLTTGEMEYLIEQAIDDSLLSAGNLAIQNEGLQATKPSNNPSIESNYGTVEIPCAMNYDLHTHIGYQSGGNPSFVTGADKSAYLASIANGPAYGAQYMELIAKQLTDFTNSTATLTWHGISNYGSTPAQNINMLSQAMAAAETVMVTNSTYNGPSGLCPLPNSGTGTWTFP